MDSSAAIPPPQPIPKPGKNSDFIIKCKGTEFLVHKAVLSSQSEFFEAMLRCGFKEANEHVLDLPDDDPATIARMIKFLYKGHYDLTPDFKILTTASQPDHKFDSTIGLGCLRGHILVYQVADKYGVPDLAQRAMRNIMDTFYDHFMSLSGFSNVVKLVFEETGPTDRKLRSWLVHRCARVYAMGFLSKKVEEALWKYEPVAWGVARRMCNGCAKEMPQYDDDRDYRFNR